MPVRNGHVGTLSMAANDHRLESKLANRNLPVVGDWTLCLSIAMHKQQKRTFKTAANGLD